MGNPFEKGTDAHILWDALDAASDHLDFCNYGDSYERECAMLQGLDKEIAKALLPPENRKKAKREEAENETSDV